MARRIDTQAEIDWIRLADQGGDPASPAAGYKYFYAKSGGIYLINSAGTVLGPIKTIATDEIWDAAGDIVQGTGANTASRLAIGTAYQIPRVNSGATALEYASAGRVLISEQTPTGTGTVTWDSISNIYSSLEIEYTVRGTAVASQVSIYCYFNNDTTAANYRRTYHAGSATNTNTVAGADDATICTAPAASALANGAGYGWIKIPFYKGTTFYKGAISKSTERAASNSEVNSQVGMSWENTAPITRVDLVLSSGNYDTGSTLRLYGVF